MERLRPFHSLLRFVRREPALAALLAGSFLLNVYAFTFPTWNPDYLVRYAWNARGLTEWNHGAFYYGSWHINVIKVLIIWPLLAINWVWPVMTGATAPPQTVALYAARWLAAAMGAGCAGWTWGIARRLAGGGGGAGGADDETREQVPATTNGGRLAGFVAGFGVATTPLVVTLAHFTTADVPSLFWALGCLYFLMRHTEEPGRRRWWLLMAVFLGLTASTKYVGALFGAAALAWLAGEAAARRMTLRAAARDLGILTGVSLGVFALASFEMWFFPGTVRENIMLNVNINRAQAEAGTIGFAVLPGYVPRALGWLWVALAAVGIAGALARRGARRPALLILAALAANYLFFGSAYYYPFRYVLPFLPLLLIFAGAAVAWGVAGLRGGANAPAPFGRFAQRAALVALAGAGVVMALRAGAAAHQFTTDTRLEAEAWLAEHAALDDRVAFNLSWFLYFPELPEGVAGFNLAQRPPVRLIGYDPTQRPPEGWRVGAALAANGVRWVMTSSFVFVGNQTEWEQEFYPPLARGEAPYAPAAEFRRERTWLHDPRSVEFLNPVIRVYERRGD